MSDVYVAGGRIETGQIMIRRKDVMADVLSEWPDCEITITIERARATRSLQANAYYWAVVIDRISRRTGYSLNETHDILKQLFLPKDICIATGNGVILADFVIGGSTTSLDGVAFYEYCEEIRRWALENFNPPIDIPPPDPDWKRQALADTERLALTEGEADCETEDR